MERVGAVVAERGDVVPLHQVQDHQGEDAGAVRRHLPDVVAAVVRADRLDPDRCVVLEVGRREVAAVRLAEGDDAAGDAAAVERVAAVLGQRLVGGGEPRVPEHVARDGRPSAGQVGGGRVRPFQQRGRRGVPLAGDDVAHREPAARIADGRRQHVGQRQRAEAVQELLPAVDRTGNRPGERAVSRHPLVALADQRLAADRVRRAAGRVQGVQPLRVGVPHQREQVAADAVHVRLHQAEHGVDRHRGVDGVAARLQDVEPDLRRKRLAGRHHPVGRNHLRAAAVRAARRPAVAVAPGLFLSLARGTVSGHHQPQRE